VNDMIDMVGAELNKIQAVQVGGPSGALIGPDEFKRVLGFEDLATGGSIIIFDKTRDLLKDVVLNFTEFFIEESCGSCSTCRIIPVLLRNKLQKILNARGIPQDIIDLQEWSKPLKASRCGLGHTAANPIISSIRNFRYLYDQKVQKDTDYDSGFDLNAAIQEACEVTGRIPSL
jgi:[NiFe] hydrogenase diaphorase moiety large subunit